MRLDYLPETSDGPLIRLFDFTPTESEWLHAAVLELAGGKVATVAVHELSFVEPVADCRLELTLNTWDQAVVGQARGGSFACGLTAASWQNVADRIEPFITDVRGFQWLTGVPGEATILLSSSGQW